MKFLYLVASGFCLNLVDKKIFLNVFATLEAKLATNSTLSANLMGSCFSYD